VVFDRRRTSSRRVLRTFFSTNTNQSLSSPWSQPC